MNSSIRWQAKDVKLSIGQEATMNLAESLKEFTTVVADTGDIEPIARHRPQDAPLTHLFSIKLLK